MRLSSIIELILIFLFIAFAAARVVAPNKSVIRGVAESASSRAVAQVSADVPPSPRKRVKGNVRQDDAVAAVSEVAGASVTTASPAGTGTTSTNASAQLNKHCQCTHDMCNCCRDFKLGSTKGPGCSK